MLNIEVNGCCSCKSNTMLRTELITTTYVSSKTWQAKKVSELVLVINMNEILLVFVRLTVNFNSRPNCLCSNNGTYHFHLNINSKLKKSR